VGCDAILKNTSPALPGSLFLVVCITLLVVGILGATSILRMDPAAAYGGCMGPAVICFIICCVVCCQKREPTSS